jgi:hypothetical protein
MITLQPTLQLNIIKIMVEIEPLNKTREPSNFTASFNNEIRVNDRAPVQLLQPCLGLAPLFRALIVSVTDVVVVTAAAMVVIVLVSEVVAEL